MNDPGIDGAIGEQANDVEKRHRAQKQRRDDRAAHDQRDPSRWWLASTAAPLVAGTFGPMASAFNICALVAPWRIHIDPGLGEPQSVRIDDPEWLVAVNGLSLAVALLANLALLLNMARRLPFSLAQSITIVGWYTSALLLIVLVAVSPSQLALPADPNHVFSQAFYYAIISAAVYGVVASLMVGTVWGVARGHYGGEFKLSPSQRTLMLQTIAFLLYLLAGAAVFGHIEAWTYLDAVYWADVSLLTIGLGDFVPASHLARSLLFPFAIGGILILGLVIGSIRSLVLERGKEKMSARMVEKIRERAVRSLDRGRATVRLTAFSRRRLPAAGHASELDRRRQEFEVMRDVQRKAAQTRRWYSLLISALVWMALWTVGAVVFWHGEAVQGWSYFEALYFAYVALLTIGYGDLRPMSESSKAFFVFWSLLAVPSVTVLISNMGDTVVKYLRDAALWIGDVTVLPGEAGVRERLKQGLSSLLPGDLSFGEVQPVAAGSEGAAGRAESGDGGEGRSGGGDAVGGLAQEYEGAEAEAAHEAARRGDAVDEDKHHYRFMLMREIRSVLEHVNESPPRKYSYEEWAWYLKLIGRDEASARIHPVPAPAARPDGAAGGEASEADSDRGWSWIGEKSPLIGNKDEAEWVLEKLASTLENELRKERDERRGAPKT